MRRWVRFAETPPTPGTVVANQQRWGHAWMATERGWEPVRLAPGQTCNGFAVRYPDVFVGVYSSAGSVWLQAGPRDWDASTIVRVRQLYETIRFASYEVSFVDGSAERIDIRMPRSVVLHRRIDPTYDEIESLADDMMKIFPYVASDGWTASDSDMSAWISRVLPLWESGVNHGP